MRNHEKPWKTNLEPWETMKNHENPWRTMKNQPRTMKIHEEPWKTNLEPWKTMKNHDTAWESDDFSSVTRGHNWKPWKTMKNHENPWKTNLEPWKINLELWKTITADLKPWKTMITDQEPWKPTKNHEKPWKSIWNHEKPTWNHEKPWQTDLEPSFYKWFLEMWRFFGSQFLADFWTFDESYTPWTPNIILFQALIVIFNHFGGFGLVFRFLKNEPFLSGGIFPFPTLLTRYRQSEFARFFELCFGHSRWPQTTYYPIQYMLRT